MGLFIASLPLCIFGFLSETFSWNEPLNHHLRNIVYPKATAEDVSLKVSQNSGQLKFCYLFNIILEHFSKLILDSTSRCISKLLRSRYHCVDIAFDRFIAVLLSDTFVDFCCNSSQFQCEFCLNFSSQMQNDPHFKNSIGYCVVCSHSMDKFHRSCCMGYSDSCILFMLWRSLYHILVWKGFKWSLFGGGIVCTHGFIAWAFHQSSAGNNSESKRHFQQSLIFGADTTNSRIYYCVDFSEL